MSDQHPTTRLFVVPTPVGNLGDMTFRAVEALKSVELILAEDTRVTGKLLKHFEIETPMRAFHAHNEHKSVESLIAQLKNGLTAALVSDAGTPGLSDPGYLLFGACAAAGVRYECLPGANALLPALQNSALPMDRFVFEGFLPHKKGRKKRLQALCNQERTMVFYESPYRIVKFLEQALETFGPDRQVAVSREISKLYEETFRGSLQEALAHFQNQPPKGEFVVALAGKPSAQPA